MQSKTRTIKVRSDTYRKLKIMAAERGETMLDLLDRIVEREQGWAEGQEEDRLSPPRKAE